MRIVPDKRITWRGVAVFVAASAAGVGIASIPDRWVYSALAEAIRLETDWLRALRVVGYVPVWLAVAAAMLLVDSRRARLSRRAGMGAAARRAVVVSASPLLAGALSEIVKLLVRRLRPFYTDGAYVFRPWSEALLKTGDLGFPSGHTAVAFGAMSALCFLYPRAAPVWLLWALGCGVTRLCNGAHFLSDVVGGAVLGWAAARLVWQWTSAKPRRATSGAEPGTASTDRQGTS